MPNGSGICGPEQLVSSPDPTLLQRNAGLAWVSLAGVTPLKNRKQILKKHCAFPVCRAGRGRAAIRDVLILKHFEVH